MRPVDVARGLYVAAGQRPRVRGAVVLAYHDVEVRPTGHYSVTPRRLRRQLRLLKRVCEVVHLDTIVARLVAREPVDGLGAVTFDDGLAGLYRHGLDVIMQEAVPATVFAVTEGLGEVPRWGPSDGRLMTLKELREVAAAGMRIQSHTSRHLSLPSLAPAEKDRELRGARERLAELLGVDVSLLAYPFGHHDASVRAAAAAAGYTASFSFLDGRVVCGQDAQRLPRLTMWHGHHRIRLASHLARPPQDWPDSQVDLVLGPLT